MHNYGLEDVVEVSGESIYLSSEQQVVLDYLKQVVGLLRSVPVSKDLEYSCIEEFVLKNGCWFESAPLPAAIKRGKGKACAYNATRIALDMDYVYVEGFALVPELIPVFHSWCSDSERKVVDPTWKYCSGTAFFGVPFNQKFMYKVMFDTGYYGILGPGRPYFPLLEGKFADSWRGTI